MNDQNLDRTRSDEGSAHLADRGALPVRHLRQDDAGATEAHHATALPSTAETGADAARLHPLPAAEDADRRAQRAARPWRSFGSLPISYREDFDPDDVLEAMIETIAEELTVEELEACALLPIGQDPVYWLVRKYACQECTLDQIARLWGITRERVRQIEAKALARKALTVGMRDTYEALVDDGGES